MESLVVRTEFSRSKVRRVHYALAASVGKRRLQLLFHFLVTQLALRWV